MLNRFKYKYLFWLLLILLLIFIGAYIRLTPVGIGMLVPKSYAQSIQQSCPGGTTSIVGPSWQSSNPRTDALIQWGCLDGYGNLSIGGNIYVARNSTAGFQSAINTGILTIYLSPGTYNLTNTISMVTSGQHLVGSGIKATTLQYIGTAAITALLDLGTAADGTNNLFGISVDGMTISGTSNVTYDIRTRGVHRWRASHLSLINATTAGLNTNFSIGSTLEDIHISSNEQAFTQVPASCIILDGPDASHQTTIADIIEPICEGVSGTGWIFNQAFKNSVIGGTSEGNNKGATFATTATSNMIEGTDFEVDASFDFEDNGNHNACLFCTGTNILGHVTSTAVGSTFIGGQYNSITVDSGARLSILEDFSYNGSTGAVTDNGTNTTIKNVWNTATNLFITNKIPQNTQIANNTSLQWLDDTAVLRTVLNTDNTGSVNLVGYHGANWLQSQNGANYINKPGGGIIVQTVGNNFDVIAVPFGFSTGTGVAPDSGISRTAAGTVAVGNGTQGDATGNIIATKFSMTNPFLIATNPTISSGFGTSPSIVTSNGSNAFTINVGTGGTATSGVIGFPAAANGWNVFCQDTSTFSTTVFITRQTATGTTTATIGNFNTSAASAAWTASDILSCTAFPR